jgi:hypothetical protein
MHRDLRATNPRDDVIDVTSSFSSPDNAEESESKKPVLAEVEVF